MHELSVTESILEIALRHAREAQARQISQIYLVIGELSSIVDDSVQFYWDIVAQGTLAAGAQLNFRRIPTRVHCEACLQTYHPLDGEFSCPACQSAQVKVINGEEFYLEAIDIEK